MLPHDPVILLSVINTKLRDCFKSLDELCRSLDADKAEIVSALESIGYKYNEEQNQFKQE